ncbi:hypothetical protein [Pseudoalteromonas obscura]|uniref:Uncharacterized protein n=1 Tax=Pseudoalteromonas obscura TaxID=3048491 RepID=A0ABT7EPA1_9GAMM|nr:hypothetical protein [Pseudoalteromonas sp. P94(2023)]MDK2596869.1 hypothetical protein [Pseudoalteromonas sp. P94(2023)]
MYIVLFYGFAHVNTLPFHLIGAFGIIILSMLVLTGQWLLKQFRKGSIEMMWEKAL